MVRWMTTFLATSSLLFGHRAFDFDDITHYPVIPAAILIVSNFLFLAALRKKYNPRYFGFTGAVIDIAKLIRKQIGETVYKSELDAEVRLEREKNRFAAELIKQEKALNSKLADIIQTPFFPVQMAKMAIHQELIDYKLVF